jgi:uncharacterized protein (TIGR02266 family)
MRIKLKYPDVETFISKYAVNISRGGIFIATKTPKPVGTMVRFEFLLANAEGTSLIRGDGQVQWVREFDPTQPQRAHGMGVKFIKLDDHSQAIVDRALAYRAASPPTGARRIPGAPSDSIPVPLSGPNTNPPREDSGEVLPTERGLPVPIMPEPGDGRLGTRRDLKTPDDVTAVSAVPEPEPQPQRHQSRAHTELTRPVNLPEAERDQRGRPRDVHTKPIELPQGDDVTRDVQLPMMGPDESVEIALKRHRIPRNGHGARMTRGDEIDALAREWGITDDRWRSTLRRKRPRMVEATAELEKLLRRPPAPPTPTLQEAMAGLAAILKRPR